MPILQHFYKKNCIILHVSNYYTLKWQSIIFTCYSNAEYFYISVLDIEPSFYKL